MEKYRPLMKPYYYDPSKYGTYLEQLGITYPTVRRQADQPRMTAPDRLGSVLSGALRGGLAAVLLLTAASPAAARALLPDRTSLLLGVGPAFDAHTDLLASPFRQAGAGFAVGLGSERGGRCRSASAGRAIGTSSRLDGSDAGLEDGWMAGLDVAWLRRGRERDEHVAGRRAWCRARPSCAVTTTGAARRASTSPT